MSTGGFEIYSTDIFNAETRHKTPILNFSMQYSTARLTKNDVAKLDSGVLKLFVFAFSRCPAVNLRLGFEHSVYSPYPCRSTVPKAMHGAREEEAIPF